MRSTARSDAPGRVGLSTLLVLVLAAGACAAPTSASQRRPASVTVQMSEYAFALDPPALSAGRAVLRVRNAGSVEHEMVVVALPEDAPSIEEELASEERPVAATVAYLSPQAPGEEAVLALDLTPGRYAMLCFVEGEGGTPHVERGMHTEFRVR